MPLAILLLLGLTAPDVESATVHYRPTSAEAEVPAMYRLGESTFAYSKGLLRTTENYDVSSVTFPSPVITTDVENNTVHAEYFRPTRAGKRPAVIVLHILGADFALSRYMAARMADQGVAALFVKLPYYGERRPKATDKRFLSADIDRSVGSFRQGVLDVRRAAAWLATRSEIDPDKLGVAGISLGGIISSLAAAVDPTLNRAALLLAGGNLHEVLWEMPEGAKYRRLWIESGRTKDDLKTLVAPFDPLTYAHRLKGKRLMMMAGNVDEVVPPSSARALWNAAGKPPITWLDCGHYSAAGFLLPAIRQTVEFFATEPLNK